MSFLLFVQLCVAFASASQSFAVPPLESNNPPHHRRKQTSPVIGILTTPTKAHADRTKEALNGDGDEYYYIASSYVKWLESAGARSIAIPYYAPEEEIRELFSQVNGVLFPGGEDSVDLHNSTAPMIYKLAKHVNEIGHHFPLWGTCLGFEYLFMLAAADDDAPDLQLATLEHGFDSWNMSLPLHLSKHANESELYQSEDIRTIVSEYNITLNNHQNGISPDKFTENGNLTRMFRILSTNKDRQGKPFVSSMEAADTKMYPFYGVQFHPEKSQFEYQMSPEPNSTIPLEAIDHSPKAIAFSQHLATVFVNHARRNRHRFLNPAKYPTMWSYEQRPTDGFEQVFVVPYHPPKSNHSGGGGGHDDPHGSGVDVVMQFLVALSWCWLILASLYVLFLICRQSETFRRCLARCLGEDEEYFEGHTHYNNNNNNNSMLQRFIQPVDEACPVDF